MVVGYATRVALDEVWDERKRQEQLCDGGKFPWTCANRNVDNDKKLKILGEEYGEVCRALCEGDLKNLKEELIQVAAVAVAWVESLEQE